MNDFGQRIRALREAHGWTQSQLAKRTGGAVSAAAIGHLEVGRRANGRLDTALAIACALGMSIDELLHGDVTVLVSAARAQRGAQGVAS